LLFLPFESTIEIDPIEFKVPIETVQKCFQDQFYKEKLWRLFDTQGHVKEINIIDKTDKYLKFNIIKEHSILGYSFNTTLIAEQYFNRDTLITIAKSTNGFIESRPSLKLIKNGEYTTVVETTSFSVPFLFAYFTKQVALKEHSENLYYIKSLLESNPRLCDD
jgi:hypothetical protein